MTSSRPQAPQGSATVFPLQYVKGIGPRRAEVLAAEGIHTTLDLVYNVPVSYIDRSTVGSLQSLQRRLQQQSFSSLSSRDGIDALRSEITVVGMFQSISERQFGKSRKMLVATFVDDSSVSADVVFWNYTDYYKKLLKRDVLYAVSGRVETSRFGRMTFSHPEVEVIEEDDVALFKEGRILPKYRITQAMKNAGLTLRSMRLIVEQVLEKELDHIQETLRDDILAEHEFAPKSSALRTLHFPESREHLTAALRRMKFEELFFFELMLALRQQGSRVREESPVITPPSPRARKLLDTLPFQLTNAQKKVVHEIVNDMGKPVAMNRLLQGDVGSGKTIVALLSMLMAADRGYQALLLAPTEILAEQHYQSLQRYCAELDLDVLQVVGGQTKKQRRELGEQMQGDKPVLIVGTHALFGGTSKRAVADIPIPYKRVGLIVIDEQHRFGVLQRARLRELGLKSYADDEQRSPHILVMSATPIPRTLSMTAYGDLDVSTIDELPPQRQPVRTRVVFESNLQQQYDFIRSEVREGRQAFIVYPLVEESDKLELKAATQAFDELRTKIFPDMRCGLLHGQMLWYEKEDAMKAFLRKEFDILVATTVIEVGIDIPNATVMLIQNAERFGLSQLHQLRGRVGRGAHQSYCLLATKDHFAFHLRKKEADQNAKLAAVVRLRTLEQTTDGFRIAEVDLKLRGPGDVLGTRQSGLPAFHFVDLIEDGEIVAVARNRAFSIVERDPQLRDTENQNLRREYLKLYGTGSNFFDTA